MCNDGKQVEAHKVVLASTSPFFMELFKRNKHPHPLLYMKGVKGDDLMAMVEFLYSGEANVDQRNLDTFLALANDLRLKGLNGTSDEGGGKSDKVPPSPEVYETVRETSSLMQMVPFTDMVDQATINNRNQPKVNKKERALALNNSSNDEDLDNQIRSMMRKSENDAAAHGKGNAKGKARICKVCGKEGDMTTIQRHIEANHVTGLVLECNICGSTANTRHAMEKHMNRKHNK